MRYTSQMHLDQAIPELIQVAGFLTLLLLTRRQNSAFSNGVLLWFACSLTVDALIFKCSRPHYVQEVYNSCNVVLGWIVLYEKYKLVFRHVVVLVLSVFK